LRRCYQPSEKLDGNAVIGIPIATRDEGERLNLLQ
jgi:hypothetical protein